MKELSIEKKAEMFTSMIKSNAISLDIAYNCRNPELLLYVFKKKLAAGYLYASDTEILRILRYLSSSIDQELIELLLNSNFKERLTDGMISLLIRSDNFTEDFYIDHVDEFSMYYNLIKKYKPWGKESHIELLNTVSGTNNDYLNKIEKIKKRQSCPFEACSTHTLENISKYYSYYDWEQIIEKKPMKDDQIQWFARNAKKIKAITLREYSKFIYRFKDKFSEEDVMEIIEELVNDSCEDFVRCRYITGVLSYNSVKEICSYGKEGRLRAFNDCLPERVPSKFIVNYGISYGAETCTIKAAAVRDVPGAILTLLRDVPSVQQPENRSKKFKEFLNGLSERICKKSYYNNNELGFVTIHGDTTVLRIWDIHDVKYNLAYIDGNYYEVDEKTCPVFRWKLEDETV